jgi:hypothetical protein
VSTLPTSEVASKLFDVPGRVAVPFGRVLETAQAYAFLIDESIFEVSKPGRLGDEDAMPLGTAISAGAIMSNTNETEKNGTSLLFN